MTGRWKSTSAGLLTVAASMAALLGACSAGDGSDDEFTASRSAAAIALPPPLKAVAIPEPDDLGVYVKDKAAAIALGKALFWDMQLGSDGETACATCHFNAGADSRTRNQIAPGLLRRNANLTPNPDLTSNFGKNYRLRKDDFPFHRIANVDDRSSAVTFDSNDVVASQGVAFSDFQNIVPGSAEDATTSLPDPQGFRVDNVNVRRAEPRNTPTVINAVFNYRQFWDGRAQQEFNGVNSFGDRDPFAFVYRATTPTTLDQVHVSIKKASLASQALSPPLSSFEMSANGRTFNEIGDKVTNDGKSVKIGKKLPRKIAKKLGFLIPLGKQVVDPTDSVLGSLSRGAEGGLTKSYDQLIKAAFQPEWWKSNRVIRIEADGSRTVLTKNQADPNAEEYSLAEYNFGLLFGLAVQLYEATLVSDDTPFDRYVGGATGALTAQQVQGMNLFFDTVRVRCVNCHGGAEFTDASFAKVSVNPLRRREGNLQDRGFNNIGLRPTLEDLGVGDTDPWGRPLSHARLATLGLFSDPTVSPPVASTGEALSDDGAFKTPTLRNVELTAPYFHNGGALTLRQVVDVYSRGGDQTSIANRAGQAISGVVVIGLSSAEKDALAAFLVALTDERVRYARAPFDHPQLFVPNGHKGDSTSVVLDGKGRARDRRKEVPAVGRAGGTPLPKFLEGTGEDD